MLQTRSFTIFWVHTPWIPFVPENNLSTVLGYNLPAESLTSGVQWKLRNKNPWFRRRYSLGERQHQMDIFKQFVFFVFTV